MPFVDDTSEWYAIVTHRHFCGRCSSESVLDVLLQSRLVVS